MCRRHLIKIAENVGHLQYEIWCQILKFQIRYIERNMTMENNEQTPQPVEKPESQIPAQEKVVEVKPESQTPVPEQVSAEKQQDQAPVAEKVNLTRTSKIP